MPSLNAYVRLAPFSIDELVEAANSVLRERPRLHVSRRTVRYYVSVGVLPPPEGSPKFARYGAEHLVRLVGGRALVDQGVALERIPDRLAEIYRLGGAEAARQVQTWLESGMAGLQERPVDTVPVHGGPEALSRRRAPATPIAPPVIGEIGRTVRRVELGEGISLELPDHQPVRDQLELAAELLEKTLLLYDSS